MSQDSNNTNLFSAFKRPREVYSLPTIAIVPQGPAHCLPSLAIDHERLRQKHVRRQRSSPARISNEAARIRRGNATIDGSRRQLSDVHGASPVRRRLRLWCRNDALVDGWEPSRIRRRDVNREAKLCAKVVCARLAATAIYHAAKQRV